MNTLTSEITCHECSFAAPNRTRRRRFRKQMEFHKKRHTWITAGRKWFKCDLCKKSYPDKVLHDFHDSMTHKTKCCKCSNCSYTTRIRPNLWQHCRHHHRRSNKSLGLTEKVNFWKIPNEQGTRNCKWT